MSVASARPCSFAVAALTLTFSGWVWFVLCFTARAAAWWNSLLLFAGLYVVAIFLALHDVRSWVGIAALILAASSLTVMLLLLG
jgi:hypothetical protein